MSTKGHLPKRSLEDLIRQRQRVLRGREETWWERNGDHIVACWIGGFGIAWCVIIWVLIFLAAGALAKSLWTMVFT